MSTTRTRILDYRLKKRKGYKSSEGFELRKNFLNIEEQIFLSSPKPRD